VHDEVDRDTGEIVRQKSRHTWLSNEQINHKNVHERCNLGARYRWGIEESMNTEKHLIDIHLLNFRALRLRSGC